MEEQPSYYIIVVLGIGISFFGFVGAVLLGVVGYFLRSFHGEYKIDKAKTELKEEKMDAKIQNVADGFATKLEMLLTKIGDKINQLPKGSDNLSQVMLQYERDVQKRMDEHSQRIQNNYTRIEQVAVRVHELAGDVTAPHLRAQIEERRSKRAAAAAGIPVDPI